MGFTIKHSGGPSGAGHIADHMCLECGLTFELNLASRSEHDLPWKCPDCNGEAPETLNMIAAPVTIVRGNSDFADRQNERLYKRSSEHFKREGRDEAISRQRKQFEREGMVR